MENAIEIKGLTKRYDRFALDRMDLILPVGCVMGLIGENGAGKTTAIKSMLGLIRPDGGEIRLLGKDPQKDRSVMEDIGLVLDSGFFPPEMNARSLGTSLKYIYKNWDSKTYRDCLEKFQLDPKKQIKDYSRGMTMKLSLAAALSHRARLLILDEATSGLDPVSRDDILDVLLEFIQDENRSVLLSSHITGDLEKISDYIVFLHGGRVVMNGEKDMLLDSYGILKCAPEELGQIDPTAVVGLRRGEFGITALVEKYRMPGGLLIEPAVLEDLMLYSIKGEKLQKEGK